MCQRFGNAVPLYLRPYHLYEIYKSKDLCHVEIYMMVNDNYVATFTLYKMVKWYWVGFFFVCLIKMMYETSTFPTREINFYLFRVLEESHALFTM